MSVTSSRVVQVQFSGDITEQIIQSALDNEIAFGQTQLITLDIGDNTIIPPVVSGLLATGLTIIPPAGNVDIITLKGDTADVGIPLHLTDPTSLGLDESFTDLILVVEVAVNGVRLIWS